MKAIVILFAVTLCLAVGVNGQRTVSELKPAHAVALQKFLSTHKGLGFLQEYAIEDETLADMRKYFGRGFKPYYVTGDFNRDGRSDFAMILSREGTPKFATEEEAEARKEDRNLALIVWNGTRKGFVFAHAEEIEAPLTCMIQMSQEKKPKLYFGVYESDADTFALAPAGKGYIMEFDKSP